MKFQLTKELINGVTLVRSDEIQAHDEYYGESGDQHYRLLSYLANQFDSVNIIEIGTHNGHSALALSANKNNTVYTFDLVDKVANKERLWINGNVQFSTDNLMDDTQRESWRKIILESPLIFIDIDPHDGFDEYQFYLWLLNNDYKGILLIDDIWYFKGMRDNLWYKIPTSVKYDITEVGHWSGTGVVAFSDQKFETLSHIPVRSSSTSNDGKGWTVVTAYFDLTRMPDASPQIEARDFNHYFSSANMTMALDVNLVVYCDSESFQYLRQLRPDYLKDRTQFIVIEFTDLDIIKDYYAKVLKLREETGYNADPRNTASYYLFCMSRYELLQKTMRTNPFGSTHFAWCNICIERMNWKNCMYFPQIWKEYRDKFSTCYIDYQPKSVVDNLPEYYKFGRCSMCSGFFTGNKHYMSRFCDEIMRAFSYVHENGYGHADEQLFSIVYFKCPEIFDVYFGDYTEMIVNYSWIHERPLEPVKNLIRNLCASGENRGLLKYACNNWLLAYSFRCFKADNAVVDYVKGMGT